MRNFELRSIILFGLGCVFLIVGLPQQTGQAFTSQRALATATNTCPDAVTTALNTVDKRCAGTGRNSACYGHTRLEVEAKPNTPKINFVNPGDKIPLKNMQMLHLDSFDPGANDWGIAVLRVQANLPDSAPGQNVTMLLFGNVQMTDASETTIPPTDVPATFVPSPTIVSTQSATPTPTRKAPAPTPTSAASAAYKPMQAFYFSSGVGEPRCQQVPEDGILIQSPQGSQKIDLMIDEARVVIGSTVFMQAQASKELIVNTLEGSAQISAFGRTSLAGTGTRVRVPLDANLRASGPPSGPEPYDANVMQPLPTQHLPQKVSPAAPAGAPPPGYALSTWRFSASGWNVSGPCVAPASFSGSFLFMGVKADGSVLWPGANFTGSGGSYLAEFDITFQGTLRHNRNEYHVTAPGHIEGSFDSKMQVAPFCHWAVSFHLDQVGDAGPTAPPATATPAATP